MGSRDQSATETISAVIDAHTPSGYEGNVTCWCDQNFDTWAEHATHVVALILAALNLTEEWTWSWPNGSAPGVPGYGYAVETHEEAIEECDGVSYDIVRRLVGPWLSVNTRGEAPDHEVDEDGDPVCSECRRPQPREWCWFASKTCPLGMPPRWNTRGEA